MKRILKERSIDISHNKIHRILKEGGMVMEDMNKRNRGDWWDGGENTATVHGAWSGLSLMIKITL
ncbi:MAG: hypothetical protein ACPLW7_01315 [Minisyncoccia bacterium]